MQFLFVGGALPFLILGVLHIAYTIADAERPRRIVPRDRELLERMRTDTLVLTRQTTVWRAWIGFNLSHGIGVMLFGAALAYGAVLHFEPIRASAPELLFAAPVIASLYFVLSLRYWFRVPAIGTGIGAGLLLAGAVMAAV